MKVAAFIANRIAFNQRRSFSRFIIRLSIFATIISVAVMIITLGFTNGFQKTVSGKVFSFWGHIRIQEKQPYKAIITEESPLTMNDTLIEEIRKDPAVASVSPFATKYVMLKVKDDIAGVLVKGLDKTYDFSNLKEFIQPGGRMISYNDSTYSREVIISSFAASQLNVRLNDRISVYFFRENDEPPGRDRLTVVGIYKTGIAEYDETFAIADIRFIRRMNQWPQDLAGGYEIFLKDYKQIDNHVNNIFELDDFPITWDTQSIRNISPNIFDWLNMQDLTRNILIAIMITVAVINLISCLIILVLERIRMIGVLKALGASDWTIQKIFLIHSIFITVAGVSIGAVAALGFLYVQMKTGFIKLDEASYYISTAAVDIVWWQVFLVCALTLIVCVLVLFIPILLVRRIQPVKAIQFR